MTVHNVLSIDGCGFRGLTQLLVLEELMKQHSENPKKPSLPCDVFSLICGTATGGLIAILLGRLQMSCEQAINAYHDLESGIFDGTPSIEAILAHTDPFNTDRFRERLEGIIRKHAGSKDALMLADVDHNRKCRTLVTVVSKETSADVDAERIRSYENLKDPATTPEYKWSILDAALGTTSCPRLFDPLELGNSGFMAANTSGFSNPSMIAYLEALSVFGQDAEITLISLGMGLRTPHSYESLSEDQTQQAIRQLGVLVADGDDRMRRLINQTQLVATSTQVKHLRVQVLTQRNPKSKYMRLDPPRNPKDQLVFVDYVQREPVQNIVNDFLKGKPSLLKTAVSFIQRQTSANWLEIPGSICQSTSNPPSVAKGVLVRSSEPLSIMKACDIWERSKEAKLAKPAEHRYISCFAIDGNKRVQVFTGDFQMRQDDHTTSYVRVLLDDKWRFFPQRFPRILGPRIHWDKMTDGTHRYPVQAILTANGLKMANTVMAFTSDGLYTKSKVNPDRVDIPNHRYTLPYHGTWVRTGNA